VGLHGHETDMPAELNPTQRRRAIIAHALINGPDVLLHDEPTAELDEASGAEILELLAALHTTGLTIVFSTKSPHLATGAHRIVHVANGRIDHRDAISAERTTDCRSSAEGRCNAARPAGLQQCAPTVPRLPANR
jgi:putative ABC transport system ATP-binding protein